MKFQFEIHNLYSCYHCGGEPERYFIDHDDAKIMAWGHPFLLGCNDLVCYDDSIAKYEYMEISLAEFEIWKVLNQ